MPRPLNVWGSATRQEQLLVPKLLTVWGSTRHRAHFTEEPQLAARDDQLVQHLDEVLDVAGPSNIQDLQDESRSDCQVCL